MAQLNLKVTSGNIDKAQLNHRGMDVLRVGNYQGACFIWREKKAPRRLLNSIPNFL